MRQLTAPTNLLLALLAAAALAFTLGLPWYAPEPVATAGEDLEGTGATIARWFGASGATVTGADALVKAETILMALAAGTAGLSIAVLVGLLRSLAREVLRIAPLATPVVVMVQILSPPAGLEIRWGAFAALVASLVMASAAFQGAELRAAASSARRRRPAGGPAGPPAAR